MEEKTLVEPKVATKMSEKAVVEPEVAKKMSEKAFVKPEVATKIEEKTLVEPKVATKMTKNSVLKPEEAKKMSEKAVVKPEVATKIEEKAFVKPEVAKKMEEKAVVKRVVAIKRPLVKPEEMRALGWNLPRTSVKMEEKKAVVKPEVATKMEEKAVVKSEVPKKMEEKKVLVKPEVATKIEDKALLKTVVAVKKPFVKMEEKKAVVKPRAEKRAREEPEGAAGGSKEPQKPTDFEQNIYNLVYYFVSKGRWLREIGKEDDWVPISMLINFNRLAALSSDIKVVVEAVIKSDEGLLEISEDHTKVRQNPAKRIKIDYAETRTRTLYVKGFPLQATKAELLDFFKQFGKVPHLIMRTDYDEATKSYKFKGSVFVVFENVEQAKKCLEAKKVKYCGHKLFRKFA